MSEDDLDETFAELDRLRSQVRAARQSLIAAGEEGLWQALCRLEPAWTLSRAAMELGLSPNGLNLKLRRATGLTFHQQRIRLRLLLAVWYLKRGQRIVDAAFASGFGSLSALQRLFRRHFNASPTRCWGRRIDGCNLGGALEGGATERRPGRALSRKCDFRLDDLGGPPAMMTVVFGHEPIGELVAASRGGIE